MLDHLSLQCDDVAASRRFFERLLEPREWPEYHAGYYGVFVRDLDGNNVEAVTHRWG